MNCAEVQELLSAYYDGELVGEKLTGLREHLGNCEHCAGELAGFENLSSLASGQQTPAAPEAIWDRLESQLDQETCVPTASVSRIALLRDPRLLGLAATILVAVGLGWVAYGTWGGHGDHSGFVAEFGHYLKEFRHDPEKAQEMLVAKYDGEAVDPSQAIQLVGYRPVTANSSSKQYKVRSTHVLRMPCCTCVQTVCERSDGSTVAIFEHDDENPEWFGDQQGTMANCSGKRCQLFDVNDRIAASWKSGTRHITVIGVQDENEVAELVAWLEGDQQGNPS
jgi:hypothetical protein